MDFRRAKVLESIVAKDDANQVASEEVKEQMVPPALPEVGKPVTEADLTEFKTNGAGPSHIPISHDEHLAPPAEEVGDEVTVVDSIHDVRKLRGWVLRSEDTAVLAVTFLREWLAKIIVENPQGLTSLVRLLQKQVSHEHGVENKGSHERSPENGMGSRHDRVGQVD